MRLDEFICNEVGNRRIVIVLKLTVLDPGPGSNIGNPVNVQTLSDGDVKMAPAPAAAAAAAPKQQYNHNQRQYHPIASLNPYQARWCIKARVTAKSDTRTWSNARTGEGKLFSVDLLDADGGQIKATMFNDAHDKFYPLFQVEKVYSISKGVLKPANKKFNRLPNEYEITLNADAEVEFLPGDDKSIETQKFDFTPIEAIQQVQPEAHVDIIGVVSGITEASTIVSQKTQKTLTKRVVTVTDQGMVSIDCTLWGDQALNYTAAELPVGSVVAIKTCRVSDFGGRSLSATFGSQIFVNPDRPEAHTLRQWYDTFGKNAEVQSLSKNRMGGGGGDARKHFVDIKDEQLGMGEKPSYFTVRGMITFFKNDSEKPPWYTACPSDGCSKKVNEQEPGSGAWFCESCNKTYPNMEPRYILSLLACDHTGSNWMTAFNESAVTLVGKTAQELKGYIDSNNLVAFNNAFTENNFKRYVFKCRAKADTHQDEIKVRVQVTAAEPINYVKESKMLLDEIAAY